MSLTHHSDEQRGLDRMLAALDGVELTEQDRLMLRLISGWGPDISDAVASLLIRVALAHGTRPTPSEPATVRAAYDAGAMTPDGAAAALAEGLPSYMVLGVEAGPPRTPWWRCRRCGMTYRGASLEGIRGDADAHVRTVHGGAR